jgi:hypothetical protein
MLDDRRKRANTSLAFIGKAVRETPMTKSLLVAAALLFAAALSPASAALTPNTSSVAGTAAPVLAVGIELPGR